MFVYCILLRARNLGESKLGRVHKAYRDFVKMPGGLFRYFSELFPIHFQYFINFHTEESRSRISFRFMCD